MELLLEVVMYLLVVLGIITVCCTFFSKINLVDTLTTRENVLETAYRRVKRENEQVIIMVKYKNLDKEELEKVQNALENGKYTSILDIADKVKYIDISNKK